MEIIIDAIQKDLLQHLVAELGDKIDFHVDVRYWEHSDKSKLNAQIPDAFVLKLESIEIGKLRSFEKRI